MFSLDVVFQLIFWQQILIKCELKFKSWNSKHPQRVNFLMALILFKLSIYFNLINILS